MLRAEDGGLVAAKNGRLEGPTDALTVEALGCREALVWIQRHGLRNVTVESNSLILVTQNKQWFYLYIYLVLDLSLTIV